MDEEDVVHVYNGILFTWEKEDPDICDNTDEPRQHYAMEDKPETSSVWYHL